MKTLTKEEFERLYGTGSTQAFFQSITPKPVSFARDFKNDLTETVQGVGGAGLNAFNRSMDILENPSFNPVQKTAGVIGAAAGGVSNVVGETVVGVGKAVLPQSTEDALKSTFTKVIGSVITPETAQKAKEWYSGLDANNKLIVDSAGGIGSFMFDTVTLGGSKAAVAPIKKGVESVASSFKPTPASLSKNADDVVKQSRNLRQSVQSLVGERSVDPQFKASAERAITKSQSAITSSENNKDFLKGSAQRTEDVESKYVRYLTQSEQAINDIKVDPAISEVGSKMGDSFEMVIKQRQAVGKVLGDELKEWGKLRVSVKDSFNKIIEDLDGSGLSYNPQNRQLTSFQGNKFVPQEIDMLTSFVGRMRLLGDSPTVRDIDNFVSRMRTDLDFAKGASGVMKTTNAERIINGAIASLKESLDPSKNGIQQLSKYWNANKTYSELSDFVEEGAGYLGKKTQSGDFAKDASIAKSAVQSILNNGKKDWMIKLEALTGYDALDDAVIALQAMKDAGDFRGLSLLQAMKDSGVPTSKAGFVGSVIDFAVDGGKRLVAGSPADQTRAFLKSLQGVAKKTDLNVPDKKIAAKAGIPKTKEMTAIEAKIAKNVESQKAAIKANDFELVAKLKVAYQKLVTELKALIEDYKKNGIPLGLSIRKTVSPESVAKKADREDIRFLAAVIDDVKGARTDPKANQLLDNMGLGKATDDELVAFAKEVIDERDGVSTKNVIGDTPTTLLEEAKKYKSAEEFVKKSTPVFRGGNPVDKSKVTLNGISTSKERGIADQWRGTKKDGVLEELYISPDARVYKPKDVKLPLDFAEKQRLTIQATGDYDVLDLSDYGEAEMVVLNPDVLLTNKDINDLFK